MYNHNAIGMEKEFKDLDLPFEHYCEYLRHSAFIALGFLPSEVREIIFNM